MEKKEQEKPEIIPYVRPPVPPPKQQTLSEQWQEYTKSRSSAPAPVSYSAQPLSQAQLQAQYQQQWMHYQAQMAIMQQYAQAQMANNPQIYAGYPYDYSQYYRPDYPQQYVPPPQYAPLEQPYHKGKAQRGKNKPKRGGTHPQVAARPPPPIKTCENCDKEFNNITVYEQHMAAHKKCDHCDFIAIPKVLATHEQDEHGINVEIKVPMLNTEEEIAAWIAERKKNYPTKENVKEKNEKFQLKRDRGDVIIETGKLKKQKTVSLRSDLAEKSDSELVNDSDRVCKYFLKNRCRRGDSCQFKHESANTNTTNISEVEERKPLLDMLLANDIRRDRNKVLQAIRHIIKNDFLQ
ncbi:hypothetical protein HDV06_004916 [Boothiomyces sp. JEL0866]|nr:hypothetical protein HDV06_004916 [Boothiomyces sp. JEL0866]